MIITALHHWDNGYEPLADLLHQEWSDFERWSSKEKIITRLKARSTDNGDEITLVALESTVLMATASIITWELTDVPARKYWLGEVLTAPEHRGKGVAGKLIRALVDAATKAGYPALWLYTPDQQALYHHLGWQSVEEKYIENEWVTVMVRNLSPASAEKVEET
ncbi:GNAT family N-acetyltransferase [Phytobacter sp. V91]|uniref:GNAT family N-acetyltransferase n=1 Tax=Phytobacter sp. V91 TaxID=3369425 RepID=UPI003F62164E